jgi:Holliday junction resolvase RusA-like endonuclease
MKITILGKPIPAARPRVTQHGTYNPKQKQQEKLSFEIKSQLPLSHIPSTKPIELSLFFFMPIPNSLSTKKKELLIGQPHTRRPDIDNLSKQVLDAANGILYKDDSQIYELVTQKTFSDRPRTVIIIEEYESEGETNART